MDEAYLEGMDLRSAKEYIFAYAVDAKRLDKEIDETRAQAELWQGRVNLARSKGAAQLAEAALARAGELSARLTSLEAERAQLKSMIARMRDRLPALSAQERSIDPDHLLAQLQLMTGELLGRGENGASAEAELAKLEANAAADSALTALKRKTQEGSS